ncbi:MAG: hypothetical protein ACJATI_002780 [Halioglobus sp.]|jgi:hypothetical protein
MVTEEMKEDPNNLISLLNESYNYVMSIDPK